MLNLIKSYFSSNNNYLFKDLKNLILNNNIVFNKIKDFNLNDIKTEVLDYNKKNSNSLVYKIYSSIRKSSDTLLFESSNLTCDLFVIFSQKIGREYSKTSSISLSNDNFSFNEILFQTINGSGYFILQDLDDIKNIKVIKIKKDSIVVIPKNHSFVIINDNLEKNLILINLKSKNLEYNFNVLNKYNGSTLYFTDKGFIKNKNISPMYHLEDYKFDFLENYKFEKHLGIYNEFISIPEKFNFLIQ